MFIYIFRVIRLKNYIFYFVFGVYCKSGEVEYQPHDVGAIFG